MLRFVVWSARMIFAVTPVKTKFPSFPRPGPFCGSESCGKASIRRRNNAASSAC